MSRRLIKKIDLNVGLYYHVNNYYTRHYPPYDTKQKDPDCRNLIRGSNFEPKISGLYSDFSIGKCSAFFMEAGLSYRWDRSPTIGFNSKFISENSSHIMDTVYIYRNLTSLSNSKFRLLFTFGKQFILGKSNFKLAIGLQVKLARADRLVETMVYENNEYYNFEYKLNPSYLGVSLRFNYQRPMASSNKSK